MGRAGSLQPGGQAGAWPEPSNQVSNNRYRQRRTPTDADNLASGRTGHVNLSLTVFLLIAQKLDHHS